MDILLAEESLAIIICDLSTKRLFKDTELDFMDRLWKMMTAFKLIRGRFSFYHRGSRVSAQFNSHSFIYPKRAIQFSDPPRPSTVIDVSDCLAHTVQGVHLIRAYSVKNTTISAQ